jgi:hypothetical protein
MPLEPGLFFGAKEFGHRKQRIRMQSFLTAKDTGIKVFFPI